MLNKKNKQRKAPVKNQNKFLNNFLKCLKYLNLNAIVGEFERKNKFSGLNEMKLGFNSTVTEYIGEFDIILNNFSYNLYKNFGKK